MGAWPREILGASVWERAVALAGLSAENGIRTAVLEFGGQRREVKARETDLPLEIESMVGIGGGVVLVGGARYMVSRERTVRHE